MRDGRAVANSWLQMGWWDGYHGPDRWYLGDLSPADREEWERHDRSFVALAGIGWRMLMDLVRGEREPSSPTTSGSTSATRTCSTTPIPPSPEILEFLGVPWTARFEEGYRRHAFPQGRRAAYRKDLSPGDVALLDELLAPTLERYGYEVGASH